MRMIVDFRKFLIPFMASNFDKRKSSALLAISSLNDSLITKVDWLSIGHVIILVFAAFVTNFFIAENGVAIRSTLLCFTKWQ